ncbi:MAG: hypothetical protein KDJ41_12265 [Hyphomicrobiaceae bacterium]|nr:hypothetical protein [Hyphomicrobiaceae bacterium]
MRYVIAMVGAVVAALLVTMFVSSPLATWVVDQQTFDNPDDVGSMHALVFMATNLAGLVVGWGIGWLIGGRIEGADTTGTP